MNRLPRVLITLATAFACFHCASAQTPPPRVVPGRVSPGAPAEGRRATEAVAGAVAEKAQLKFEGLHSLSESDVRKSLREQHAGVAGTFDYDRAVIENAVKLLKELYAERGFLEASFELREEAGTAPRLFTLVVEEGERTRLEEIRFEGGARVPAARLEEATEKCLARIAGEGNDWREAYNYARLEYCVRDSRRVLAGEGFLESKTDDLKVEVVEHGARATVRVEEGARYRFGRVRVKGATVFLPEQIVEMLDARPGEVADGTKIEAALSKRLEDEYNDRGYIQYSYEVTPTYRKSPRRKGEGFVDLRIDIFEGVCFTVSSIQFLNYGNRLKTEDELRSALSVRAGDVYSRRRFDDGLKRLYEIGAFGVYNGPSPPYWDLVELKTDEEKGSVEVIIRVAAP